MRGVSAFAALMNERQAMDTITIIGLPAIVTLKLPEGDVSIAATVEAASHRREQPFQDALRPPGEPDWRLVLVGTRDDLIAW